jgi:hypothetical protein
VIRATIAVLSFVLFAAPLHAQSGGLFLVLPFGARSIGQGEATVADSSLGTEGLWWNPAGAARGSKREVTVHHSKTFGATSDMVAFMVPSRLLGTLSGAFYLVNYGDLPVTAGPDVQLGTVSTHNYMGALSYASAVGSRLSAGLTYKFLMLRFACSGLCGDIPVISGSTSAVDLGAQYRMPVPIPLVIGASLRNLGPALQVKDRAQADPLPRILQVGARARVPMTILEKNESSLDLMADYKAAAVFNGAAGGVGAVLGYREQFFLRTGYHLQPGGGSGPSIGFGAVRGDISIDLAMRFDEFSSQAGETPTYISLRVRF